MTLDEAIIHAEDIVKECDIHLLRFPEQLAYKEKFYDAKSCAEEHKQLAEWLKDYKRLLEKEDTLSNIKCSTCKYNETSEKCDKCYLYSEWRKVNEIN